MSFGQKNTLKAAIVFMGLMMLAAGFAWTVKDQAQDKKRDDSGIKNVIVMIPDGCDETVQTVARWYKGENLQLDKMRIGGIKTHMANSVITDSAAAATAFATGHKTSAHFLGIGPRTDDLLTGYLPTAKPYAPIAGILEAAKAKGKATGIVATSRITHATLAAFACHIQYRDRENDIMEHLVYNNIDVVFGGGTRHLIPENKTYTTSFGDEWQGNRTDGENLMSVLLDRGYRFIDNKNDMAALTSGKVWGLFDDSHMQPHMDRQYFADHQPSIAEMTAKALELLSRDEEGFFLVVEGSQVDWAGHNNDPIYMVEDFIAFDDAVKVAVDFAKRDGRTLVLAFPDHNTGGMTIGHYATAVTYRETTVEDLVDPLKGMKITSGGLVSMMSHPSSNTELITKIAEFWSLNITPDDVNEIRTLEPSVGLNSALARVISKNYTVIGWSSHSHNGETVPLWAYGTDVPVGIIDNTELAMIAADAMGLNLTNLSNRLYVDLSTVTHQYEIDKTTDPMNPVLKIGNAKLPINKDYMTIEKQGGQVETIKLPGLTIYAPSTNKVYVSNKALSALNILF